MNNQKYLRDGKWLTFEQLEEYNKNKNKKKTPTKKVEEKINAINLLK